MFLFVGDKWSAEGPYKKLQNLLLDWFRGDPVESLVLKGLDHVIVVTEIEGKIYFRTYFVKLKKVREFALNLTSPFTSPLTSRLSPLSSEPQWRNRPRSSPNKLRSRHGPNNPSYPICDPRHVEGLPQTGENGLFRLSLSLIASLIASLVTTARPALQEEDQEQIDERLR